MQPTKAMTATILFYSSLPVFAAHPLSTEDSGVQNAGNWQIELNTDRDIQRENRNVSFVANATLTYGLTETIDLAVNLPMLRNQAGEDPKTTQQGWGNSAAFLKWRLYEAGKLNLGLKPLLILPTSNSNKGLGADRLQPGVTGIVTREDGTFTTLGNLGYLHANNHTDARKNIWSASAATLLTVTPSLRWVGEAGVYCNSDPSSSKNPAFANVGLIFSPNDKLDLDVGYRRGLNKAEIKYSLGAGFTIRW